MATKQNSRMATAKKILRIAKALRQLEKSAAWSADDVEKHLGNMAKAMKAGKLDAYKRMLDQLNRAKIAE